ncbi:methyltransferase domain-containing protein [Actinomadura sp. GC306]|uniref:methyltransferase domain-containing protein n=1 Tax=Actinomadura sp. GC306 TaxID=2530367 RepID=UPI001052D3B0|nr:methyltransferase domain-containing protein [Actinomadura sp. GC306]TDC62431.1 methyltransferase domain-containing protein [Actinomadura sp. GC306]
MTTETEKARQATEDLIALLDAADRLPGFEEMRVRSYELLAAEPGTSVVDVGCGAGRAVAELTERAVRAVGVDPNEKMIAVARSRWPKADFRMADAYGLPLADASVHGYRADKVFHLLAEPERALAEARRVLVPGGRIVLVGQDWDAIMIDSDDPALTRAIVHARADLIAAPRAARRYRNLLLDAGFGDVTVEARTAVLTDPVMLPALTEMADKPLSAGAITREQAEGWKAGQRARAEADRLFMALPILMAAGSVPR